MFLLAYISTQIPSDVKHFHKGKGRKTLEWSAVADQSNWWCSYSQWFSSRCSVQQWHLCCTEPGSWRKKAQQKPGKQIPGVGRANLGNARAGKEQGCKQLAHVLSNLSADPSTQTSELLRMGRSSWYHLVQRPCPSRESLLPSPLHLDSVLTPEQNHCFDLLAKCSFSHFQLFLLHLVLLKSPPGNQLSAPAPPSPRGTLPAPAATIITFFLLELIMLPTDCNSLAAVLSLF